MMGLMGVCLRQGLGAQVAAVLCAVPALRPVGGVLLVRDVVAVQLLLRLVVRRVECITVGPTCARGGNRDPSQLIAEKVHPGSSQGAGPAFRHPSVKILQPVQSVESKGPTLQTAVSVDEQPALDPF